MSDQLSVALNSIRPLHALVEDLIQLSEHIGQSGLTTTNPATDPSAIPGAMVISYASKQNEHLRSVHVLIQAGQHRDAYLIVRTMVEGIVQLSWALNDQPDGPETWYHYGYIEDWRQLEKQRADGKSVDAELDSIAQDQLAKYGATYKDSRKSRVQAASSDPYRDKWSELSAWKMFDEMQFGRLYDGLYRDASAWVHWSPRSIYLAIAELGDRRRYEIDDPRRAATALAGGAMSLLATLQLLNWYFNIGHDATLAEIEDRLVRIYSTIPDDIQPKS